MWHEARKQERKIRGMLVDYRKRAERRRDFYEKIKADPTQFLQVHGRQCKIHLDPVIAAAADGPATMMPWQGQKENLIDRFDVRAHLDFIRAVKTDEDFEITYEERQINYERYRIIAQNSFLAISEEKFLKQLHLEEQFGYTENEPKTKKKTGGAAIGFNYEDGTGACPSTIQYPIEEENSDENSDSDLDVDLSINVSKLDQGQAHEMNRHGRNFGMSSNDFYSFLTHDLEEAESFRLAKEEEHEKALFSGRKSRRERRAHREKRLANRKISPPSYAAREPISVALETHQKSESRSPSPENTGKITFITSFGDEEEPQMPSKPTYADKVKYGSRLKRLREDSEERVVFRDLNTFKRSRSRDRNFRRRSRRSSSRSKRFRSRRSSSSSSERSRRSRRRRSLSRSKKKSISKSPSKSRSKSPACSIPVPPKREESPPKLVTRYYGRRKSDLSSSDICDSSDDGHAPDITESNSVSQNSISKTGNSGSSSKSGNSTSAAAAAAAVAAASAQSTSLSLQERLKRKRQALLNKQFKADKIAEQMKTEREKQEQQTREDELREMAIKLRRKQRERRHAYESNSSDNSSDNEAGNAGSSTCDRRSRSPSPKSHQSRSYRDRRSRDRDYRKSDKDDDYRRNRSRGRSRDRHRKSPSREDDRKQRDDYDDRRRDEYSRRSRDYRNDDHKRSDKDRDREERSSGRGLVDY